MSQTVITQAFEELKAQEAANGGVLTLDEFVFASVPDLNITDPIDRTEGLPPAAQIVHRQAVSKTGMVNSNAVVYSVVLGADVGDFEFNWVGLLNKASGVVAMIVHAPSQKKIRTQSGQQGNVLTRSFLMEYNGASTETQITTPADTWQIDFTARLNGVDERIRLENIDAYGAASFLQDGFLVTRSNGSYQVKKGAAYIEGLRAELLFDQAVSVASKPSKIWVDVCWRGTMTSVWASATKITVASTLENYVTGDEKHYVCAIAEILADGSVIDLRQTNVIAQFMGLSAEPDTVPYFDETSALKVSALSKFCRELLSAPDVDEALLKLGLEDAVKGKNLSSKGGAGTVGTTSGKSVQEELNSISGKLFDMADARSHGVDVMASDNSGAILDAMAASPGGIIIRGGVYNVGNITIDCPIEFETGAGLSVNTGATMIIRNRVSAGVYQIFYGDGNVSFQHKDPVPSGDKSSGEQSRDVHIAWFGVFPNGENGDDLAPLFQKVSDSIGFTREAVIKFGVGTYTQRTGPVTWPRAAKLVGAGDRLTNIWVKFLDGDVWKTGGGGMNAHNFQFNCDGFRISGCYIRFDHERCEAYDIYMDHGYRGIGLYGYECKAYRTKGLSWSQAAGSAVVDLGHDDCVVWDVDYTNSTPAGPEFVVRFNCENHGIARPEVNLVSGRTNRDVVGGTTGIFTVQEPTVSRLKGNEASYLFRLTIAGTSSPNTIQLTELVAGPGCDGLVKIEATGGSVFGVVMDVLSGNNNKSNCVDIRNNGAGNIRPIVLGQHDLRGVKGVLIGGTGTPPERVSLSGGAARNCTDVGYDLKCKYLTASGLNGFSNSNADMVLQPGSDVLRVVGNCLVVTDNSGAANKVIQSNL